MQDLKSDVVEWPTGLHVRTSQTLLRCLHVITWSLSSYILDEDDRATLFTFGHMVELKKAIKIDVVDMTIFYLCTSFFCDRFVQFYFQWILGSLQIPMIILQSK